MQAKVTITDMKGSESRSKFLEFNDYSDLNRQVNDFEKETNFARVDIEIEAAGDSDLDEEQIKKIENGTWE